MGLGHGRERASKQILHEIAAGSSPDEEEIFKLMASRGLSMDDATKASTVSSAFRSAMESSSSNVEAIDQLTSRLCLFEPTNNRKETFEQVGVSSGNITTNNHSAADLNQIQSPAAESSLSIRPSPTPSLLGGATKFKSPKTTNGDKPHKGKKRVLVDKSKPNTNSEATADVVVNAKMSKEAKDAGGRSKSVGSGERRGKRTASLRVEEGQAVKRVRSTSTI